MPLFTILADVIFPAFFTPYAYAVLVPWAALAALTLEFIAFWFFLRTPLLRLGAAVLLANAVSSATGLALAALMPTGLTSVGGETATAENFEFLSALAILVACVLSIAIEGFFISRCRFLGPLRRVWPAALFANVSSYVVLVGIVIATVD